jgi:hypothetical protein
MGGQPTTIDRQRTERERERDCRKEKMRRGEGKAIEVRVSAIFRVDCLSCTMQPRNDTVVGAHFGRAGQGPKMDPRRLSRLVERTAVGEGR